MSHPFGSDSTGSLESSNKLLPFTGQEQEDILSQQFIGTGGLEYPNSGSLPLTPPEDQLILGQPVETQPVSANNSDADILTGESREASSIFDEPLNAGGDFYGPSFWGTAKGRESRQVVPITSGVSSTLFQFNVDSPSDIQAGLKNPQGLLDMELIGPNGQWLAGSYNEDFSDELLSYPYLEPGSDYYIKLLHPPYSSGGADMVLNIDQAGENFSEARWLGNITGRRIPIYDFVGTNKGDFADFYQFEISEPRSLSYKVHNYDYLIDVEIIDANGNRIYADEVIEGAYSANQGGFIHSLSPGTYFAKVNAPLDPNLFTNYEVVFNLESSALSSPAPSVEWIPSPNFEYRPGGPSDVTSIIFHHTGSDNADGTISWFQNPSSFVSAHYVIDQDGQIVNMVDTNYRAWHAGVSELNGRSNVNDYSIGIEIVNPDGNWYPYTEAQYQSLESLTQDLLNKYPSITHITGHEDVALPVGRKSDPGDLFDWSRIREAVYRADPNLYRVVGPL